MLETSHRLALPHQPDAMRKVGRRTLHIQKTMGAMTTTTPHHSGYYYGYYYLGFPYANTKILLIAERIF
jgi:hypothetical protein